MPLWSQISSDFEYLSFQIEGTVFHQEQVCFYPQLRPLYMLLLVKDHMKLKSIKCDFIVQEIKDKKTSSFNICHKVGASKIIYSNVKYLIFLDNKQSHSLCCRGKQACVSVVIIVHQYTDAINNSCFKNIYNTFEAMSCWETKQSASISVKYSSGLHEKSFPICVSGFYSSGEWFHGNYIINLSNYNRQWFWEAAGYQ